MNEIEFDVELTVKELYAFSMRHTYAGISGIFGLLISLGSLLICVVRYHSLDTTARVALVIIGCLFTIVQPLMLYSKARTQIHKNKNINSILHYCLTEEGIAVSQGQQEAFVKWYDVRKKVVASKALYLYMSPVRAFIFPKEQCGEKYSAVCETVTAQMAKYKDFEEESIENTRKSTESDEKK